MGLYGRFLDADGSINAQLVYRADYKLKIQIRITITFHQSSKRHWYLSGIHNILKIGSVCKKKSGKSEYTITSFTYCKYIIDKNLSFLTFKEKTSFLRIKANRFA